jgi:hypothetical protein
MMQESLSLDVFFKNNNRRILPKTVAIYNLKKQNEFLKIFHTFFLTTYLNKFLKKRK